MRDKSDKLLAFGQGTRGMSAETLIRMEHFFAIALKRFRDKKDSALVPDHILATAAADRPRASEAPRFA
jgi:hypothetical protein